MNIKAADASEEDYFGAVESMMNKLPPGRHVVDFLNDQIVYWAHQEDDERSLDIVERLGKLKSEHKRQLAISEQSTEASTSRHQPGEDSHSQP